MTSVSESVIAPGKSYQLGYINGYLEVLSRTYNKRFVHPDDFRLLSGFMLQQQASGDLAADITAALQKQGALSIEAQGQGITLIPLSDISESILEVIIQPWLPPDEAEDLLLLIKNQVTGNFDRYRFWLANADPVQNSSNLLVFERNEEVLILGFVISNHYL